MKGIFLKKNEELYVLVGTVKNTQNTETAYQVTIEYGVYDPEIKEEKQKETILYFQNQKQPKVPNKKQNLWADSVRRMKLCEGSVIFVLARPNKDFTKADGYVCRYSGIINLSPDEEHEKERNVIGGLVTWYNEKIDKNGNAYVSMSVYIGKDQNGKFQSVTVNIRDQNLLPYCMKALAPHSNGSKRRGIFACGEPYVILNNDGDEISIYTAYGFTVT